MKNFTFKTFLILMLISFNSCTTSYTSIYDEAYEKTKNQRLELKETIKKNKKEYAILRKREKNLKKIRHLDKQLND